MAQPTKAEYEARLALHEEKFQAAERLHKQYADRTEQTAARVGSQMQMQASRTDASRASAMRRSSRLPDAGRARGGDKALANCGRGVYQTPANCGRGVYQTPGSSGGGDKPTMHRAADCRQGFGPGVRGDYCLRTHSVVVGSVRAKGTRSMSKPSLPHLQMVVQLSEREFNLSMGNLHD